MRAPLTVGADGRSSHLRRLAGLVPIKTSPPMDVLWFKLPREPGDPEQALANFVPGRAFAVLNRLDYWQVGYVFPKGGYRELRAAGLEVLRRSVAELAPEIADWVEHLRNWDQVSLLSVESSRLHRWWRPGLLLIGDAAHVMSPVGDVGINYAIRTRSSPLTFWQNLSGRERCGLAPGRGAAPSTVAGGGHTGLPVFHPATGARAPSAHRGRSSPPAGAPSCGCRCCGTCRPE